MKISIVGNAESIFENQYGDLIDSVDLVIRFNHGIPIKPKSQGTKTNILVFMNPGYKNKWPKNLTYWHTKDFPERTHIEEIIGAPASNGIVAFEKVKIKYPEATVRVFGFDWKKTGSFYMAERAKTKHNYINEKEYCLNLIKKQGWTLYQ